jgi:hypothetical protein
MKREEVQESLTKEPIDVEESRRDGDPQQTRWVSRGALSFLRRC